MRNSSHLLELMKPDGKKIPDSKISALNPPDNPSLIYTMFHIGDDPFDQLLMNFKGFPWEMMFEIPLEVKIERVQEQVLARPELMNILQLEQKDKETANLIKKLVTADEI